MPSAIQNTKIELVIESIEALVLASVMAATSGGHNEYSAHRQNITDARKVLAGALTELVAPTLRIVAASNAHKDICTKDRCHCRSQ